MALRMLLLIVWPYSCTRVSGYFKFDRAICFFYYKQQQQYSYTCYARTAVAQLYGRTRVRSRGAGEYY